MAVDLRLDVVERRILAQGETAEKWAVEVSQPAEGIWTATFYVGVQGFRLADSDAEHAEEHCMFIGQMFVKALESLLKMEKARP